MGRYEATSVQVVPDIAQPWRQSRQYRHEARKADGAADRAETLYL